jgi:hypothetical protein
VALRRLISAGAFDRTMRWLVRQLCAWCEQEGKPGILGEKEPLDDPTATHGVCDTHQRALLATLTRGHVRSAAA